MRWSRSILSIFSILGSGVAGPTPALVPVADPRELRPRRGAFAFSAHVVFLVGLVTALVGATPARAGCNLKDIADAIGTSFEAGSICKQVCDSSLYSCYAAAGIGAALTTIAKKEENGHAKVKAACDAVQGNVNGALDQLQGLGAVSDEMKSFLEAAGSAMAIVACACKTEELNIVSEGSLGVCANYITEAIGCGDINFSLGIVTGCTPGGTILEDIYDAVYQWAHDFVVALYDELPCAGCVDNPCIYVGWNVAHPTKDCPTGKAPCPVGAQCDWCGWATCKEVDPNAAGIAPGVCACKAPYTNHYQDDLGCGHTPMKNLRNCTCDEPNLSIDGKCFCPTNQSLRMGVCLACTSNEIYVPAHYEAGVLKEPKCEACAILGQKANADHTACVDACDGKAGWVPGGAACRMCDVAENEHVVGATLMAHCEPCGPGQKVSETDHRLCVPACASGQVWGGALSFGKDQAADPSSHTCHTCNPNTWARWDGPGSSVGTCEPCEANETSAAGSTTCKALDCGSGGHLDPNEPHVCTFCPPSQIWIPTHTTDAGASPIGAGPAGAGAATSLAGALSPSGASTVAKVGSPAKVVSPAGQTLVPGHCGCRDGQRLEDDVCRCPTGAVVTGGEHVPCVCPGGSSVDPTSFACVCPAGATFDKDFGDDRKCVCGVGKVMKDGACVALKLEKPKPARRDCAALGANRINDPDNPARCIRCTGGRVANADHSACIRLRGETETPKITRRCPAGEQWTAAAGCVPVIRGEGKTIVKPRVCPPGTSPDASGAHCRPDLDVMEFGGGGSGSSVPGAVLRGRSPTTIDPRGR